MKIQLLYFAKFRELFNISQEVLELLPLSSPVTTYCVQDVIDCLKQRGGLWETALVSHEAFYVAVNQKMANITTLLVDADELAIFPPVTGG